MRDAWCGVVEWCVVVRCVETHRETHRETYTECHTERHKPHTGTHTHRDTQMDTHRDTHKGTHRPKQTHTGKALKHIQNKSKYKVNR